MQPDHRLRSLNFYRHNPPPQLPYQVTNPNSIAFVSTASRGNSICAQRSVHHDENAGTWYRDCMLCQPVYPGVRDLAGFSKPLGEVCSDIF